ncbi:MaoC family dehydratase [Nocardia sp. NPDC050193]
MSTDVVRSVGGPYFDELAHGAIFGTAPAITLTDGLAAVHQSILGDRLRLPLDKHLATVVAGGPIAHPGLVADLAIGQSTLATHHVKANLFYRGLRFHRFPRLGDTLHTTTEVVGLTKNSRTPGRRPTGLAALRIHTTDQHGVTVLDFHRCAMLPLRELDAPAVGSGTPRRETYADDLAAIGIEEPVSRHVPAGLNLTAYRREVPGPHFDPALVGTTFLSSGDVVTSAPELARLTLNIAATHHDTRVGTAGRLVYGGHTIGLALAQATRALPNLVTVLGWHSCDHTGPVHEGDTLTSCLHVESAESLDTGGGLVELRSCVYAHRGDAAPAAVLDWRFTALFA